MHVRMPAGAGAEGLVVAVSNEVRAGVTVLFFVQLALIVAGSIDVMRHCRRAFRVWGGGTIGTQLNWSTGLAALSWTVTLLGWVALVTPAPDLPGIAFVLLGLFLKIVSLIAQRRAYDALVRLARLSAE